MPRRPQELMLEWRGIAIRVKHTPDHINEGWSLIEMWGCDERAPPLPLGHDGRYARHEIDGQNIRNDGGLTMYVITLMNREAETLRYKADVAQWRQLDLFR